MMATEIWKICVHEAAHAVIAFQLGLPFRQAKLDPPYTWVEFCKGDWAAEVPTEDIEKLGLHQIAGGLAESLLLNSEKPGDVNDKEQLEKVIVEISKRTGDERSEICARMVRRCSSLLEQNREKIFYAAIVLRDKKILLPDHLKDASC